MKKQTLNKQQKMVVMVFIGYAIGVLFLEAVKELLKNIADSFHVSYPVMFLSVVALLIGLFLLLSNDQTNQKKSKTKK
ncbi:MAG: hypothetical protein AB1782_16640 [Cyanobacteriota bacterium]